MNARHARLVMPRDGSIDVSKTETTGSLGVALLGYGYAGKTFHAPLLAGIDDIDLRIFMSSDATKVQKDFPDATVEEDADKVFANHEISLVVIATPNDSHFDLAKRALSAGKHVVVDKPFTTTVAEATELIELAQKKSLVLSVFHNRRWDADFLTVKKLLEEKSLGNVMHFESHFDRYRPIVQQRWREQAGAGTGIWFDLGSHLLDQALCLFGEPDSIQASLEIQREKGTAVDFFHVVLGFGKARVILHGSVLVPAESPRFVLHGTVGSYIKYGLDVQEAALKMGTDVHSADWGVDDRDGTLTTYVDDSPSPKTISTKRGNYLAYYEGVRDAIKGDAPNPVPATEAKAVMVLLERGIESNVSGKTIDL
jgi:predicted dehydrogenase